MSGLDVFGRLSPRMGARQAGELVGAARTSTDTTICAIGDSFADRHGTLIEPNQRGDLIWAVAMSGGSLRWGGEVGVGGYNTSQVLALMDSDRSWMTCGAVADMSGINDLSSSSELPLETTLRNKAAQWGKIHAAGIQCLFPTLPPVNTATLPTYAARYGDVPVINQFALDFARENPWLIIYDAFGATVDPASAIYAPLAGVASDGIHPDPPGAYSRARRLVSRLREIGLIHDRMRVSRVASNLDSRAVTPSSNQLITNPMFTGSGGSKSLNGGTIGGSVPDGWSAIWLTSAGVPVNGVITLSVVTAPGGARGLRIQASADQTAQFVLVSSAMHSYVAAGDTVDSMCDVDVTNLTNAFVNWRLRPTIGGITTSVDSMFSTSAGPASVEETLTPRSRCALSGNPTSLTAQLFLQLYAGASVDIIFSLPECRRV